MSSCDLSKLLGPFKSKSRLTVVDYTPIEANDLCMDVSKMKVSATSTNKSCASEKNKQRTSDGLMVQTFDKPSSRAEEEKILNAIAGRVSCLPALFVSRLDAELFWLIKAPSNLGFSRTALECMIVRIATRLRETICYTYCI